MFKERYSSNFISNYLTSAALYNPAGEVVVYGDNRLTWKSLDDRANRLAQALIDRGVKKDDKVLFMLHNRPEFLETNYAVQKCGAVPVPMNYRFTAPEIEFQGNHCDATVFILEDIWLDQVQKARPKLEKVEHYICLGSQCPDDMADYDSIMGDYPAKDPDVPTGGDDICVICYTGGTTGFPKGVMLTYGAHLKLFEEFLVSMLLRFGQTPMTSEFRKKVSESSSLPGIGLALHLTGSRPLRWILSRPRTKTILHKFAKELLIDPKKLRMGYKSNLRAIFPSFPFFHDASYSFIVLTAIFANQTLLLPEGLKFDPDRILDVIEKEKPHFMANVPTGWKMIMSHPDLDKYDTRSIAACISGAGLCTAELKKKILRKFSGSLFLDGFGQTEMTPMTSFRLDTSADSVTDRSVGKPIVKTRIIDEDGNDVPLGDIGEIIYKSPTIMKGYYKDEQKTSEVIKDGWFYSGDLAYFDENGEIRVVERKNECINTGGEKVFPLEVEQVIYQHPAVKDVCIIGVPDEKWGSSIRAVVQLKEGKDATEGEIIGICEGKIAGYKKPRSVTFVDEFPLSPVGKVLRSKIRELYGES